MRTRTGPAYISELVPAHPVAAAPVVDLGWFGPLLDRSAFVALLLVAAVIQAVLAQKEVLVPKLLSRKAS